MLPRPHLATFRRLEGPRDASTSDVQIDLRGAVGRPALDVSSVDRKWDDAARLMPRGRITMGSIVVVEAIVFLAIVATSVQGPADLSQSAWVLAGLSLLFLVLSQLRRLATTRVREA